MVSIVCRCASTASIQRQLGARDLKAIVCLFGRLAGAEHAPGCLCSLSSSRGCLVHECMDAAVCHIPHSLPPQEHRCTPYNRTCCCVMSRAVSSCHSSSGLMAATTAGSSSRCSALPLKWCARSRCTERDGHTSRTMSMRLAVRVLRTHASWMLHAVTNMCRDLVLVAAINPSS